MKKAVTLLLMTIILFSISHSLAYDQEITFQGIPWGSTQDEWIPSLKEIYGEKITEIRRANTFVNFLEFKLKNGEMSSSETDLLASAATVRISDTIGGYDVLNISFDSIFADNEKQNYKETFLYQVSVALKVNNPEEAEKDLFTKLTSLYGKKSQDIKNVGYYKLTLHCWLGADDTFVLMGQRPQYKGDEIILVWYGKMIDPDEFRKQLSSQNHPLETYKVVDPSDTKGL